jgi:2-polyprenyl-3-methyl-5-hydroxy-6-metoxy-1,4-benzoquinol methylase
MISQQVHGAIAAQWAGEVFQNWERVSTAVPFFERKLLHHLAGRRVLEIGCNAGIYAWHIAPVAESYVGIELRENFVNQAHITARHIQGAPVRFVHASLKDSAHAETGYNAVFASYVLYHVSDEEVKIFEKVIAPRCDVLVVQFRTRKKRSANSHDLMKARNVEALFRRTGFDFKVYWKDWRHTAFGAVGYKIPRAGFDTKPCLRTLTLPFQEAR